MRKTVITVVTLVLFIGVCAPTLAFADDEDDNPGWNSIFGHDDQGARVPKPIKRPHPKPDKESKERHSDIENLFEDITGVIIPPILIKPGNRSNPNIFELPVGPDPDAETDQNQLGGDSQQIDIVIDSVNGVSDEESDYLTTQLIQQGSAKRGLKVQNNIDPNKNQPIQIKTMVLTDKTPRDEFIQDATVFGGVLGSTALALLALTGFNTLRLRKDPKANYIYEAKD